jgi:omega-6 fatty acid desaturase (delta-12 desaturase)
MSEVLDSATATASDDDARGGDDARAYWRDPLAPYAQPRLARSLLDIATSVVPYLALSVVMYLSLGDVSYLITLCLAVPTAGFLLRTYILFHDCAHGSLFRSKRANVWLGRVFGLMVLAPFSRWRHDHAVHHGTSGDLDRRGVGDIPTLTVAEYKARSRRGRLGYRAFRNPVVMFGVGPIFAMIIGPRIWTSSQRPRMRHSVMLTDAALLVAFLVLGFALGFVPFLLVWTPPALLAGSAGIWLFYVQHQFEDAYWESSEQWSYADAALRGSSYLKLPKVLQFFTGNIGLHHVHHLSARVPNYNLQRAHDEVPLFHDVPVLTMGDGLRATRLKLWDGERGRLVTFAEARRAPMPAERATAGAAAPSGARA